MYASLNNSIYREIPFTDSVEEILSYKTTIHGSFPDLRFSYISLIEMTVPYIVTTGERVLIFSTEFPNGAEEIIGTVVDNLNGTWTAQFTGVYTVIPSVVYDYPIALGSYPVLETQAAEGESRLLFNDETLTYVSGTVTEFVGTSLLPGLLKVGDEMTITYNDTTEDLTDVVTLTNVSMSGTGTYTYTCTFDEIDYDAIGGLVLDRSHVNVVSDAVRSGDPTLPGYTVTYEEQLSPTDVDNPWNLLQRQITSPINWTITEPMTLDYSSKIK